MSVSSQQNFIQGEIKDLQGETTKGFIDYQNWKQNPTKIYFKETLSSPFRIFSPKSLLSFNVSNDRYISKTVTIDKSERKIQNLAKQFYQKNEIRKVFLKLIFESDKTLYHFVDENKKEHFYIDNNGKIEELIYKIALINSKKVERKKYGNLLFQYLGNCDKTKSKIRNLRFSKEDFLKLFKENSNCLSIPVRYIEEKEKLILKPSLVFALSNSTLKLSSSNIPGGGSINERSNSRGISFGGAIDIVFPKNRRKQSIYNELMYYSNDFSTKKEQQVNTNVKITNNYDFSLTYIKLSNAFRFSFSSERERVNSFINVGLVSSLAVKKKLTRTTRTQFIFDDHLEVEDIVTKDQFDFGILVGLGIKAKKLSIEARFETNNQMLFKNEDLKISNQVFFLLLSYSFF